MVSSIFTLTSFASLHAESVFFVHHDFVWIQLAQFSFQFLCGETVYDSRNGACHIVRLFCQYRKSCNTLLHMKALESEWSNPRQEDSITPTVLQPHHQWFVLLSTLVSMLLYHGLLMFFPQSTPFTFPG